MTEIGRDRAAATGFALVEFGGLAPVAVAEGRRPGLPAAGLERQLSPIRIGDGAGISKAPFAPSQDRRGRDRGSRLGCPRAGESQGGGAERLAGSGPVRPTDRRGASLALYRTTWKNPRPEQAIRSLDFRSAGQSPAPFLIAVTSDPP